MPHFYPFTPIVKNSLPKFAFFFNIFVWQVFGIWRDRVFRWAGKILEKGAWADFSNCVAKKIPGRIGERQKWGLEMRLLCVARKQCWKIGVALKSLGRGGANGGNAIFFI